MIMTRTLILIKSHAAHKARHILMLAEGAQLVMTNTKRGFLKPETIRAFYAEHKGKPYFDNLVASVSGRVVAAIAVGEVMNDKGAVERWRQLLGATDPAKAEIHTIRGIFGNRAPGMMHENAAHGSDGRASAERECALLFDDLATGWLNCSTSAGQVLENA